MNMKLKCASAPALRRSAAGISSTAMTAVLALSLSALSLWGLGLLGGVLIADDGGSGAGGDTVGTLPLMSNPPPPPPELISPPPGGPGAPGVMMPTGPATPILTLEGPVNEVQAMIVDAYGDGGVYVRWLGNGIARFEFYGRDTVLLDRTLFQNSFVKARILVGSSFQGAIATIKVDDVVKSTRALVAGTLDTRLHTMTQTGLIDHGVIWHAESVQHVHAVLAIKGNANLIKLEQRD